jgi:hypothetical protein
MRSTQGPVTPESDEGQTVPPAAPQDQNAHPDSHEAPHVTQALRVIEGEAYAAAYLQRLQGGTAQPDELAVVLSFLTGDMLRGACRVIEKALVVHHA